MAGSSASGSLPHALTVAYQRLCEALNLGVEDFKRNHRFSNAREICLATEAFVHEFCYVRAWQAELEWRSGVVRQLTGSGTAYDQAETEALRSYKGRPRKPSGSKFAIENLRNAEKSPTFLYQIDKERNDLEVVLNHGVLGLRGSAKDAFRRWSHECYKIQCEAKRLEADGCHFLYHVHQAADPNSSEWSQVARTWLEGTSMAGVWLKPMLAAADSLVAWVEENPAGNGGPAETTDQQKPEETAPAAGETTEESPPEQPAGGTGEGNDKPKGGRPRV